MLERKQFRNHIMLTHEDLLNACVLEQAIHELQDSLCKKLLDEIQDEEPHIVRLTKRHERDTADPYFDRIVGDLHIQSVPVKNIEVFRDIRFVEVTELHIEAINCKNCAAPIPVGTLDRHGDTLVRCSYCGTYHTIRKRDGNGQG